MLKKNIAPLLVCAVMWLTSMPLGVLAQTPAQPELFGALELSEPRSELAPDLKTAIAEAVAKTKSDARVGAESVTSRRGWQNQPPASDGGYTTKDKILIGSVVVGLIVLAVVIAAKTGKGGRSLCEFEPDDPDCIP